MPTPAPAGLAAPAKVLARSATAVGARVLPWRAMVSTSFPAVSAEALLAAFAELGLDTARLRRAAGLGDGPPAPDALAPGEAWDTLWADAVAQAPRPELPTEAGLAVPFGAFGMVDYLAGSAATVRGALRALADHFATIATGFRLAFDATGEGDGALRVINAASGSLANDEFVLATVVGRFRALAPGAFGVRAVWLTRPPAPSSRHRALFDAPVAFGASAAALDLGAASLDAPLRTADVRLHQTLARLAAQLGLGGASDFECAVRGRLRDLMPHGRLEAANVARSLGVSERTLHRRLAESGQRYHDVVDAFRVVEAERLLVQGRQSLADVALALGFSDQTAWNRAFRRWKGASPTEWVARRRAELAAAPEAPPVGPPPHAATAAQGVRRTSSKRDGQ